MKNKKLEALAELLLDTGKRNRSINFKNTKNMTVEVLFPSIDVLVDKLTETEKLEIFDPADVQITEEEVSNELNKKEKYKYLYTSEMNSNQILVYNNQVENILSIIKNISKKAKEYIDEKGINVAYMTFGVVHWKENESSGIEYQAPILFIPIIFSILS